MASPYFDQFLAHISRLPLLTAAREQELAAIIQSGGHPQASEDALHELIERNIRLVVKIAGEFVGTSASIEDLVSAGTIGLVKAAGRFEPRGLKFSTYASTWIRQACRDEPSPRAEGHPGLANDNGDTRMTI